MKINLREPREVLLEKCNVKNLLKNFILNNLYECEEKILKKNNYPHKLAFLTKYFIKNEKVVFIFDTNYSDFFINVDELDSNINFYDSVNQKIIKNTIDKFSFFGNRFTLYKMTTDSLPTIDSF